MNGTIVFSPKVINKIQGFPEEERIAIASALAKEFILGITSENDLTPVEGMLLSMLRFYVKQDTERYNAAMQK
jgi:hypothetical protein